MTDVRHAAGQRGEDLAAEHFERLGFEILARNHRTRFGELDLVAFDGETLVFVEVKTRRSGSREPWESLHDRKRSQVRRMAIAWLTEGTRTSRPRPTAPSCASTASPRPARRPSGRASCASTPLSRPACLMLARVMTFAVDGVDARRVWVEADIRPGPARVHRRRARRQGGARGARAGPRRARELGLRVPAAAHHRQPRAGLPAQGRAGVRPAARGRAARRLLSARAGGDRGRARWSASSR